LKKNKDASYKPINVTEDELNNYIEKLPITHYCHCCRKRNLYQKYRNTIKKQKNFYFTKSSAEYNINHIEKHKLKLFEDFQDLFKIKFSSKMDEKEIKIEKKEEKEIKTKKEEKQKKTERREKVS